MSNCKYAYGWSGHILVSSDDLHDCPPDNVIAVKPEIFDAITKAFNDCKMDDRIQVERLGVINSDFAFLATGANFSEGFKHFGTVFDYAELLAEKNLLSHDHAADYMAAMKEIYGLELPPCRLMVGCSSEH